jgi:glycosyltransferase involved in cell wall biosynthesis
MSVAYTVALCTHDHADRLVRTLADLRKLRLPDARWELLIVDNGCNDATASLLAHERWPAGWQVRVVREEKLGLSNARNCALCEASGDYLIFIDDDETPDPDWLCAFEALIRDHAPDAFGGPIEVLFEGHRPAWLTDDLLGFLGQLNRAGTTTRLTEPGTSFNGGNFGVRRTVCKTVGGFDPALGRKGADNTGGEEVDFYRRLLASGFKVWWTPKALIFHRIQAIKLKRSYFHDLHYRQGQMEAIRKRGSGSRVPPKYLIPQFWRALRALLQEWRARGPSATVRKEMNVAYFIGYLSGWAFGEQPRTVANGK